MKINNNFLMVSNYNADISWILDYTDNYIIYDRSDTDEWIKPFDQSKVIKVPNIGWDIYDKLTYIIDNYDELPNSMILTKGNIFKYITPEEFDEVCNNTHFTPLFTKRHKTYMPVCFYSEDGMYNEINNSWYLKYHSAKYFHSYNNFISMLGLKKPKYLKFSVGSNYIVTRENIHKHPKSFYEKLRCCIDYGPHPGEAQIIERFMYTMWTTDKVFDANMIILKEKNFLIKIYESVIRFIYKYFRSNILTRKMKNLAGIKGKILIKLENKLYDILSFINTKIYLFKNKNITEEYRKKIKIYDVFTYNGEADILDIRLNILNKHVDEFVIVEAPTTFSGLNKPLYFELHKERFAPFLHKIKYFVIDDYPNDSEIIKIAEGNSNVPKSGPEHWKREFYQKESIKKALYDLSPNDICFIGDVDEIWNPEIKIDLSSDNIFKLKQIVYSYFLNNRSNEPWAGTIVTKYSNIKNKCLNDLRTRSKTVYTYIQNGGWHFTSMGGIDEIRRKLNDSYTKDSYNTEEVQKNLQNRFGESDYMGRGFIFTIDEQELPLYIKNNKNKYAHLFKSNPIS